MNEETYVIYRILNTVTGKSYIGKTKQERQRRATHFSMLRKNRHYNKKLQRSFDKHGERAFDFTVLEKGISNGNCSEREIYWINHFDSFQNGYNLTIGGENGNGNGVSCEWNGVIYASMSDAAIELGINRATLGERLSKGYVCDEDMRGQFRNKQVIWNGIKYPSIYAAAKALGINKKTMQTRLEYGYSSDEDMPRSGSSKKVVWNGVEYHSLIAASEAAGIGRDAMRRYLSMGYSSFDDLANPKGKPCMWNGVRYPTIAAAARARGISENTMSCHLNKGYTCDEDLKRKRSA